MHHKRGEDTASDSDTSSLSDKGEESLTDLVSAESVNSLKEENDLSIDQSLPICIYVHRQVEIKTQTWEEAIFDIIQQTMPTAKCWADTAEEVSTRPKL